MANYIGLAGATELNCSVTKSGELSDCIVVKETPEGFGFGEAAIRMAPEFLMRPQSLDGSPVGGAKVTIPLRFRPEDAPTSPPPDALAAPKTAAAMSLGRQLAASIIGESQITGAVKIYMKGLREQFAVTGTTSQQEMAMDDLEQASLASGQKQVDRMAAIFAASVSEPQLAEIATFLKSPAGQSFVEALRAAQTDAANASASTTAAVRSEVQSRLCRQIVCLVSDTPSPPAKK